MKVVIKNPITAMKMKVQKGVTRSVLCRVQSDVNEEPAEPTSSSVQHGNKRTTRRGAARSKKGSDD